MAGMWLNDDYSVIGSKEERETEERRYIWTTLPRSFSVEGRRKIGLWQEMAIEGFPFFPFNMR